MTRFARGYMHFDVRGIPLYVHWTVPLGGLLVAQYGHAHGWAIVWLCLAYPLLILAHESGHALAAHCVGSRVLGLWVNGLGGHCRIFSLRSNRATFVVYSAGVVAQFILLLLASAYVAVAGWPHDALGESLVITFTFVNLVLIAVALIPHVSTDRASDGYVLMKLAQHVLARKDEPFVNPGRSTPTEQGPVFPTDTHLLDKLGFAPRDFSVGVEVLNDDTTPMDFVIVMLMRHVKMDRDEAMRTMFEIHLTGGKIIALADRATAEQVANGVAADALANGFAFVCRVAEAREAPARRRIWRSAVPSE
jgi:ATP-dependent Clp protease adaptor protein ClpS